MPCREKHHLLTKCQEIVFLFCAMLRRGSSINEREQCRRFLGNMLPGNASNLLTLLLVVVITCQNCLIYCKDRFALSMKITHAVFYFLDCVQGNQLLISFFNVQEENSM